MAKPMKSKLIERYAGLIGDSSSVGGETSAVVYRAAKDMDDFIKIELERDQQLYLPVAVIYISYGVLIACLFALLNIAPSIGSINISFIGGLPPSGSSLPAGVSHLDFASLRSRFLDLGLIVSLGNGAIIGAFTEGNPKYGLVHALAMAAGTMALFIIIYP
jgi:archaellum biogenesis protein FlaJ (TadC family)